MAALHPFTQDKIQTMPNPSTTASGTLPHPSFELVRQHPIPALKLLLNEYRHGRTGARHFHISADHDENVFLVAFPTVPMDSTGVAHILEHTSLCGSERYPVRDPFFMMIRRSLNTFMNAFTSSDWTAYPFASQNRKDFFNLLDVYLDATFFSRLDPLDFAQEGHRLEFEQPDDPSTPLCYRGVVYNEMKGAMSSPTSLLWQTLTRHLYPTTTYHFNSGGEPDCIPQLSHAQLLDFYRDHYHPSNAIFMTFGNLPVAELQQRFEQQALHRFDRREIMLPLHDEQRFHAPVKVLEYYPTEAEADEVDRTHLVIGWLLGHCTDLDELLEARFLSAVLLDNSASPLLQLLETSALGSAPSPLCGLEDGNRELLFVCGLEGSRPEHAEQLAADIMALLEKIADEGVPQPQIEAVLHQLELTQREISGDGYPFGLQLLLAGLGAAVHGGDPAQLIDLDPALAKLRRHVEDPDYIKQLVRRLLLDNFHRVHLTLAPDPELAQRREQAVAAQLARIKAGLDAEQSRQIVEQAAALKARQNRVDDESILPRVTLADVPATLQLAEPQRRDQLAGRTVTSYGQGTNGLLYQQLVIDLPQFDESQLLELFLYASFLTDLGLGADDYLSIQQRQSQISGGYSAQISLRGKAEDEQQLRGYLVLSGKALLRNHAPFVELLYRTLAEARFDELPRLRELIAQIRTSRERSITGSGHSLAMSAATASMSPLARLGHRQSGLAGIRALKALDRTLDDPQRLAGLAERLQQIHQRLVAAPKQELLIAEPEQTAELLARLAHMQPPAAQGEFTPFALPPLREPTHALWLTNTQVNFCARAYPTVPASHADAAALTVLGGFLRNGYLHRAIREQGGAYGGGAGQDSGIAAFRFYSYRDPRLSETLADFDRAIDWVLGSQHELRQVEEAILGAIGSIDKPGSPAGEAKRAFFNQLHGRNADHLQQVRQQILRVTLTDLQRVTERYLKPELASTAILTDSSRRDQAAALRLQVEEL